MKRLSLIILSILFVGCISFVSCGSDIDSQLKMVVEEANKMFPMEAGDGMRIEKLSMPASKTLKYDFTYTTMTKDQLNVDQMLPIMKPAMVNMMKSNPNAKMFVDKKVTCIFAFADKNGDEAFEITLTPEDYK